MLANEAQKTLQDGNRPDFIRSSSRFTLERATDAREESLQESSKRHPLLPFALPKRVGMRDDTEAMKALCAEALGTFALVFAGTGAIVINVACVVAAQN